MSLTHTNLVIYPCSLLDYVVITFSKYTKIENYPVHSIFFCHTLIVNCRYLSIANLEWGGHGRCAKLCAVPPHFSGASATYGYRALISRLDIIVTTYAQSFFNVTTYFLRQSPRALFNIESLMI